MTDAGNVSDRRGLTIGSLFSGIGGLELGLEQAGLGPVLWQVENDEHANTILAKRWPGVARFSDVRTVGTDCLAPVDIVCGGFPCQDISYAGKGAGLSGSRSGLWREFARIVGELGPRYVVVENVNALLRRGIGEVLGTLASFGYDAIWDCIPACAAGAPHRRDRIFIVAYALEGRLSPPRSRFGAAGPSRTGMETDGGRPAESRLGGGSYGLPDWVDRGFPAGRNGEAYPWEPPRAVFGRSASDRAARIARLGNAVSPAVAFVVGMLIRGIEEQQR